MSAKEPEWRPVVGFDGYEVSDQGQVRSWRPSCGHHRWPSARRATPKVLQGVVRFGYVTVGIFNHIHRVHRLVLEAFVGPCPEGMECRHLDGDRQNNHRSNLAWGTRVQNASDRNLHGTHGFGETSPRACVSHQVAQDISRALQAGERVSAIARRFGVNKYLVSNIKRGRTWSRALRGEG